MRINFLLAIAFLFGNAIFSQTAFQSGRAFLIGMDMAYQNPSGDWTDQFGDQFSIGPKVGWKFANDWILTLSASYGFGGTINDPGALLNPVLTDQGNVLNQLGSYAIVSVYQRNTYGSFGIEKILNFWRANKNSGPTVGLGAGYLWHWINIDNAGNDSPQIIDEYEKGYDQFSHGFMLHQSIGYTYFAKKKTINFKLSFELMEAFTQNQRLYDYSTGTIVNNTTQNNLMYGLKLTWYIPVWRGGASEEYYYD